MVSRYAFLLLAAIIATPAATPAAAQDKPAQDDVVVTAKRAEVVDKIDRRSYDVRSDPQAKTAVLADVLKKIPSVTVSPDDGVELRGQSGVTILIDGKPSTEGDPVRTMSAARVTRVEVITNPSAQFSPDGTGGIINIITDKRRIMGLSGNLSAGIDSFGNREENASLSLTRGKWTLSGGGFAEQGEYPYHGGAHQVAYDANGAAIVQDSDTRGRSVSRFANFYLSVARKMSDKATLTVGWQHGDGPSRNDSVTRYVTPSGDFSEASSRRETMHNDGLSANYVYDDEARAEKLTLNANVYKNLFGAVTVLQDLDAGGTATSAYTTSQRPDMRGTGLSAEYERTIDKRILIAGASFGRDDSDIRDVYTNLSGAGPQAVDISTHFRGRDDISALYATYQFPVGTWTLLPGLRAENEAVTLPGRLSRNIVTLYPTLHLSRDFGPKRQLKLSYSRRTQRPNVQMYDPTPVYSGAKNAWAGNPDIRAVMTDAWEASYDVTGKTTGYTTTVYYRVNHGDWSPFSRLQSDGVLVNTTVNAGRDSSGGAEFTVRGPLAPKWKYMVNADVFYDEIQSDGGARHGAWTSFGNANLQYDAAKRGELDGDQYQVSVQWRGKKQILQGYNTATSEVDLNYRHALNRKLAVVVSVYDLFNSAYGTQIIDTPTLKVTPIQHPRGATLKVALAYAFGGS